MRHNRKSARRGLAHCACGLLILVLSMGLLCSCARVEKTGDPKEWIKSGWDNYRLGEFNFAVADFEAAAAAIPESDERHLLALYGLATTWNLRRPGEDIELAQQYYDKVIELAPDHDLAAWSLLAMARMKHLVPVGQDPDYDEVRAAYQAVIDQFPRHLAADEAFVYLQSTYVATLDETVVERAKKELLKFVEQRPDSGFVTVAYSLLSVCYEVLDEPAKRLEVELKAFDTSEVDPTNPFQDNAWRYWMLAALAEFNVGDFETARKYYGKLIEEYPTDIRVYSCEQALERMDRIEDQIRREPGGGS